MLGTSGSLHNSGRDYPWGEIVRPVTPCLRGFFIGLGAILSRSPMTAPSGYGHGPPAHGSPLPLPTADPPARPPSFASVRYRRPHAGSAPPPCGGLAGPGCAPADARFASLPASCSAMGWVPWAGALHPSAQSVAQRPRGSSAVRAGAQDRRTESGQASGDWTGHRPFVLSGIDRSIY